ncbi:hypothetical protein LTR53_008727 [Teratosphaeriaceae sp. CCFEE 6253]|nr:hypothetical protein LTR53_008727 [Teratosphaeriaceae sp. CCFEE 6253]
MSDLDIWPRKSAKKRGSTGESTSFTTKRVNATTFVVQEHDAYGEIPLIYVKQHPTAPVIILSDTGCDEPSEKHKHDKIIHLRDYLEHHPVSANNSQPLNPGGKLKYIIICTHCHYDHTLGVPQFLAGGTTEIVASAAGRDFIESDLNSHGLFKYRDRPAPYYQVTKWAQAFERLQYPFKHDWDSSREPRRLPHLGGAPMSRRVRNTRPLPLGIAPQRLREAVVRDAYASPANELRMMWPAGLGLDPLPASRSVEADEDVTSAAYADQHRQSLGGHGVSSPITSCHDIRQSFDFDAFIAALPPVNSAASNPCSTAKPATVDLGITIIQTPGHTPDELAWYDHAEMHLSVGDSFYREGAEGMPIIFPGEGSLIEWVFSMQKLAVFVRSENARAAAAFEEDGVEDDGWVHLNAEPPRVKVSCAHQTYDVDGAEILAELEAFSFRVFIGKVPVVASKTWHDGEIYDTWQETGEDRTPMSIFAPRRMMEEARKFFGHDVAGQQGS